MRGRGALAALRTLQKIESENRTATPEEQDILSKYVGWGALADVFDEGKPDWTAEYKELRETLSPEEYESARASTLNAHYTSPTVIKAIYQALDNMGFKGGNILEPSCGAGNFFGLLPDSMSGSKLYGVELDGLTGRIAKQLYPNAHIEIKGYENTNFQNNSFDIAIGNVPFGQYQVFDPAYNKLGFSIHNYFFAKTIDQVRPGGIIAFVTSRYTMDSKSTEAREYIAQRTELLGAIRLPNNAFLSNAGTEVVTDILFLQKREQPITELPDWVKTDDNKDGFAVNSYFFQHPEMVLGIETSDSTRYGQDYTVKPHPDLGLDEQLSEAIAHIGGRYVEAETVALEEEKEQETIPADPEVKNFSYTIIKGDIYYGEDWTLREISASEGYKVSSTAAKLCEIPAGTNDEYNDNTASVTETIMRGGVSVEKRDSITGSTPQGNADFSGITFEIINDSRNPVIVGDKSIGHGEVALTLTTDSEGKASTAADALPYGSYVLHESATNESMLNTAPDQPVEVTENGKVYPFFMDNEVVRGGVLIEKRDLESKLLTPLGGASLDGTLFEITNKSRNAVYVNGALYQPNEVCLTIEVKDGVAQSDVRALPYGSYELAESKPGTGYLWTDKTIRPFDVLIDGSVKEYREGDAAYNQVKRGDLRFVKVGEKNMHRFANVAFKLTSQTTGESHILVTDQNGEVRTETKWNAHSLNTNGNDEKPEAEWNDETGTWFGKTTEDWMVETQDGLCALPYDYYRLEELRCEGNKGYALVTVPNIFISRDNTVIELGTIDDHEEGTPEIGTTATVDGEKTAEPLSEVSIVDTVRYSGLIAGKTYKLSGVLMDKASGAPLLVDGQQITADKEFTPEYATGSVEMAFTFDASALAGKSVVVFETLYYEGKEIAAHADITDLGQTVEFDGPEIKTQAAVDGEKEVDPLETVTLADTVTYRNLIPGKTYQVKGVLMDKGTGEKLLADGKEVTAESIFIPEKPNGTVEMSFTFPASTLAGKTIVVFESVYHEGKEVAVHADLEDEDQTIIIRCKGGLLIRKTSEDDFVEGISFIVAGDGYEETFVTDKQGQIYVQDLVPGEYTVTEVENDVTAKYIIEAGKTVTITSGDEPAEVEFHNKLKRGSVYVVKTAEGVPDTNLPGAEFAVYADVDGNAEFDPETDTLFGKLEFAEDCYSLPDLPVGGYFIHEEKAPEGYTADDGYYYFKLAEDGERVEVTNTDSKEAGFANKKQPGSLRIVKVEKDTTIPLAGATFCVKDENGQVVAEGKTDKDGVIVFEDLPFGNYVYQEVYAPEGYKLDDTEHKFEINTENTQVEVTAENEKIPTTPSNDVPKTGDTRPNPWLIGGVALLMLACAGRLLWYIRKHRRV